MTWLTSTLSGVLSFFCPCIQFGRNAENLGESCFSYAISQLVPLLNLYCRVTVRGRIREQKGIEGSCFKDLLCSWCLSPCALAQEAQVNSVFFFPRSLYRYMYVYDFYLFFRNLLQAVSQWHGNKLDYLTR